MLCWFLLYNKVNQLQLHIYPLPLEPLCHPTRYPSQPSRPSQSTKLNSLFYTAASHYIFYIRQCICMCVCVCINLCVCVLSRSVMSDSLQPHGLQPTRLLCPWDSPGRNTGVGCLCYSQFIPFSPPPCVHKSIVYVCVSIPALQIGSSGPFFQILYICINIQYLFFSF